MGRQYTEICTRSPTGKETGGDKFESVAAKSQTDVITFFSGREGVSGPKILVYGITSVSRRTTILRMPPEETSTYCIRRTAKNKVVRRRAQGLHRVVVWLLTSCY